MTSVGLCAEPTGQNPGPHPTEQRPCPLGNIPTSLREGQALQQQEGCRGDVAGKWAVLRSRNQGESAQRGPKPLELEKGRDNPAPPNTSSLQALPSPEELQKGDKQLSPLPEPGSCWDHLFSPSLRQA